MTSGNYYSGDDTKVKGDDGSVDGQLIKARQDFAANWRLAVDAHVTTDFNRYIVEQGRTFSFAGLVNAATSGADNPLILIRNPSSNTYNFHLTRATGNAIVSNERTLFKLFQNPTATSTGTAVTPRNRQVGNATASTVEVFTNPTVSSTGAALAMVQSGENSNSSDIVGHHLIELLPNQSLLITADPKSNNRSQAMTVVWFEAIQ